LDLETGWTAAAEAELDLETDAGASRIVLGFSDALRAVEEVETDERTVAAEFAREMDGSTGGTGSLGVDEVFDRTESFLVTEGDGGAPRTIELERNALSWSSRALADEFARDIDDGTPLALREDEIVFVLVAIGGAVTVEFVLDTALRGAVAVCTLFMESVRDTGGIVSLGGLDDLEAEREDAEETIEEVLATFAVRTVATESDLDTETVEDLGLKADLTLGSGSSR
jgi:hypothetical protein